MISDSNILEHAHQVLRDEAEAILNADKLLDETFVRAVDLIMQCKGRLILSGIGKSGHIARKLAATFASTGTPSYFVHAAEAAHGDLGMITQDDVVIGISYSGESTELITIIPTLKREGAKLIGMTGNPSSSLGRFSDVVINCHVDHEACPLNLAPSNSTTVTLALGDALAIAVWSSAIFLATISPEAIRVVLWVADCCYTSKTSCTPARKFPKFRRTSRFWRPFAKSRISRSA